MARGIARSTYQTSLYQRHPLSFSRGAAANDEDEPDDAPARAMYGRAAA